MPESYEDSVLRAMGKPTSEEVAADRLRKEREEKILADDQPRRVALAIRFKNEISPILTNVYLKTAKALASAGSEFSEEQYSVSRESGDVQRSFFFKRAKNYLFPPLQFVLLTDGNVQIRVPHVESSPRTLPINFKTQTISLERAADSKFLESMFLGYIAAAQVAMKSEAAF